SAPGDQPGQCREPQSIGRLVANPANLAPQHHGLVPKHQEFGILGHVTPVQHRQTAEQTAHEQEDARGDHSGMISARKTPPATAATLGASRSRIARCTPAELVSSASPQPASYKASASRLSGLVRSTPSITTANEWITAPPSRQAGAGTC